MPERTFMIELTLHTMTYIHQTPLQRGLINPSG